MNIVKPKKTAVENLKSGDCFEFCGCYYIRTDDTQKSGISCVELESGSLGYFPGHEPVIPVDIECTVKRI